MYLDIAITLALVSHFLRLLRSLRDAFAESIKDRSRRAPPVTKDSSGNRLSGKITNGVTWRVSSALFHEEHSFTGRQRILAL